MKCLPGIQTEGGFGGEAKRELIVPKTASSVSLCVSVDV